MTTTAGGHRPADPAAAAHDGVEAEVRPVLGGRRGLRNQAGLIAVAVVAISVVGAGIGLGGRGSEASPSSTPSGRDPSGLATSMSPTPIRATRRPATEIPGSGCVPVDPAALPEIRLSSTGGGSGPVRGVEGPPDWALSSPPTAAWPVLPDGQALVLERSAAIVLVPDEGACLSYAVAEYLAVDDLGGLPETLALGEIDVDPPRARVVLGSPPEGDWILRVAAHLSTGVAGQDDQAVLERFFRVRSSSAPGATPYITPAVDCGDRLAGPPVPRLYLAVGTGTPVLGVDMDTYPGDILHNGAFVTGTFPDPLELRVEGDACATSWTIEMLEPITGNVVNGLGEYNPSERLSFIAQNRIVFTFTPLGRSVIEATVNFGRNQVVRAAWELSISGPPPPAAQVHGGGDEATPRPGCGTSWYLGSGASGAAELCATQALPETLDVLTVRAGEIVSLEVPGWDLTAWWVGCGERSTDPSVAYQPIAECGLGGNGDGTAPAGPVRFIPFPGRTIVAISVNASRGGDSFSAAYYVEVDVQP